jgi:IclR family transcriptional regulator, mhp operon transcriptional activator
MGRGGSVRGSVTLGGFGMDQVNPALLGRGAAPAAVDVEDGTDAGFRSIRSIERAMAVVELLASSPRLTVAQVARASGLPRTTAYRVLRTLTLVGFASEWAETGTYGPGPRLIQIGHRSDPRARLVEAVRPVARALGQKFRWPIALASVVGAEVVVLYSTDNESPLAIDPQRPGVRLPVLESAAGLLHLAYATDAERALCLELVQDRGAAPMGPAARAAQTALFQKLAAIRAQGYAVYEREGRLTARRSIAAPILGSQGMLGSLVMRFAASAIRSREEMARMIAAVRAAAAEVKPV